MNRLLIAGLAFGLAFSAQANDQVSACYDRGGNLKLVGPEFGLGDQCPKGWMPINWKSRD